MLEVIDRASKKFIRIQVIDPVTITTREHIGWSTSFTSYLIKIETNHWAFSLQNSEVRRRFSEFCWLRSKLQCHHPNKISPPLPPKRYFHMTKFDPKVIEQRCHGLEKFLQRVMRSLVFLSDAALHLILQSDLSVEQIEAKLNEEIKPNYIKRIHTTPTRKLTLVKQPTAFIRSCSSASESSSNSNSCEDMDSDRDSNVSTSDFDDHKALDLDDSVTQDSVDVDAEVGTGRARDQVPNLSTAHVLNTKEFDFSE